MKYISVRDVAERYGVAVPTVWLWTKQKDLPSPYKIGKNTTRWSLAELEEIDSKREKLTQLEAQS